jgi:hypothetical protein
MPKYGLNNANDNSQNIFFTNGGSRVYQIVNIVCVAPSLRGESSGLGAKIRFVRCRRAIRSIDATGRSPRQTCRVSVVAGVRKLAEIKGSAVGAIRAAGSMDWASRKMTIEKHNAYCGLNSLHASSGGMAAMEDPSSSEGQGGSRFAVRGSRFAVRGG